MILKGSPRKSSPASPRRRAGRYISNAREIIHETRFPDSHAGIAGGRCRKCGGAEYSGSIVGTVADPGDAAIASAKVTITQVATGALRTASTDIQGDFVFGALQPGEYALKMELAGFKALQEGRHPVQRGRAPSGGGMLLEVGAVANPLKSTRKAPRSRPPAPSARARSPAPRWRTPSEAAPSWRCSS